MSLPIVHPYLRTGQWFDDNTPRRIYDQNFGLSFLEHPLVSQTPLVQPYWRRHHLGDAMISRADPYSHIGVSEVVNDNQKFAIFLDVSHFTPDEIKVKMVDNHVIIEGNHEEKMDPHGFVSRKFQRRYVLPKDVNSEALKCNLSHQGVLSIEAPKTDAPKSIERGIPIHITNDNKVAGYENPIKWRDGKI